jgi:hypothetical protein
MNIYTFGVPGARGVCPGENVRLALLNAAIVTYLKELTG